MGDTHVVIIGTDVSGRIAAEIFQASDAVVLGFLETEDESTRRDLNDISVFASVRHPDATKVLEDKDIQYIVAVGDITERKDVYEFVADIAKRPSANARHPMASFSQYAKIGFGNLFNAGVVINPNTEIGDMNHFHSHVSVEPDVKIGNYNTFSAGVRIGTNAVIEDQVFIGTGAIIYPGVKIGKGALVGAGSVVLKEVPTGTTVHGNPAVGL